MGTTADKLAYLSATKDTLKASLTGKGVEVPEGTTFRRMAEMVGEIPAGQQEMVTVTNNVKRSTLYDYRKNEVAYGKSAEVPKDSAVAFQSTSGEAVQVQSGDAELFFWDGVYIVHSDCIFTSM